MTCVSTCIKPSPSNAHCGACHVTFGSVSGFDRHRSFGQCGRPSLLDMHRDGNGIWRMDGRNPHADAPSACAGKPQGCETGSGVGRDRADDSKPAETLSGGPGPWPNGVRCPVVSDWCPGNADGVLCTQPCNPEERA